MDLEEPTVHLYFQNFLSDSVKKTKFNTFINAKKVSIFDRSFLYGDGIFETILVRNKKIYFLNDHYARIKKGSEILGFIIPNLSGIRAHIKKCIQKTKNCIVKIIVTRGESEFGYQIPDDIKTNIYFNKIPLIKYSNKPLKLGLSKYKLFSNSYLASIKHNNRLDQSIIARELTKSKDHDDLLVLNRFNSVIETLSSNIFFIKENMGKITVHTPKLSDTGIEGVMRSNIISDIQKQKIKVVIKRMPYSSIKKYDSCFISNSIRGVRFVESINKKKYRTINVLYNILKRYIYE